MSKMEQDYRAKLEEQQHLNDLKLKSFQDEIKKCIIEQQERLMENQQKILEEKVAGTVGQSQNTVISQTLYTRPVEEQNECKTATTTTVADATTSTSSSPVPMMGAGGQGSGISANSTNSIVDNAKYISNLRIELKNKHARHVQDLKDYYEKELDDMKKQLNAYRLKYAAHNETTEQQQQQQEAVKFINEDYKNKYDQLLASYGELKNTNEALLNKLVCFSLCFILKFFVLA
jgi:glucosamine 6-phosphate synthetase-like amidotransferase/phosphosugar isomerase protein